LLQSELVAHKDAGFDAYYVLQRINDLVGKLHRWKVVVTRDTIKGQAAKKNDMPLFWRVYNKLFGLEASQLQLSQDDYRIDQLEDQVFKRKMGKLM
jgi:hypothetical protein